MFIEKDRAQDAEERKHVGHCKKATCKRCLWIRNRKQWQERLPLIPIIPTDIEIDKSAIPPERASAAAGSWLQAGRSGLDGSNDVELVCVPCAVSVSCCKIQIAIFMSHQQSRKHLRAVASFLGQSVGPRELSTSGAPSKDELRTVWDQCAKGIAPNVGTDIAADDKVRRMQYCIYEAITSIDREFLAKAGLLVLALWDFPIPPGPSGLHLLDFRTHGIVFIRGVAFI